MITKKIKVGLLTIAAACLPGLSGAHDKCDSLANATTAGGVFWAPVAGFQIGYYLAKFVDESTAKGQDSNFKHDALCLAKGLRSMTEAEYASIVSSDERDQQFKPLWDASLALHTHSYELNQAVAAWQTAREQVRDARLEGNLQMQAEAQEKQDAAHQSAMSAFKAYQQYHLELAQVAQRASSLLANTDTGVPPLTVDGIVESAKEWVEKGAPDFEQKAFLQHCLNKQQLAHVMAPAERFVYDDVPPGTFLDDALLKSPSTIYQEVARTIGDEVAVYETLPERVLPQGFENNEPLLPEMDVMATMTIGENKLGIEPGTVSQADFMIDLGLAPRVIDDRLIFVDPWRWHWNVGRPWDWLWGFEIEVFPRLPWPGPDPFIDQLRIVVPFDDKRDQVMGLEFGSKFVMEMNYLPGTLNPKALPNAPTMRKLISGQFSILGPNDEKLLEGTIDNVDANPKHFPIQTVGKVTETTLPDLKVGVESITTLMIDPRLKPDLTVFPPIFVDPWWWHWIVGQNPWDWLRGFRIIIDPFIVERPPIPDPGPYQRWDRLTIITPYDNVEDDMVMGDRLKPGSQFVTRLYFPPDTLNQEVLPDPGLMSTALGGDFQIFDADGEAVVKGSVEQVTPEGADGDGDGLSEFDDNCAAAYNPEQQDTDKDGYGNACDGDFNNDHRTNLQDYREFRRQFSLSSSGEVPEGGFSADHNGDGRVNLRDYRLFRQLFGHPPGPSVLGMGPM